MLLGIISLVAVVGFVLFALTKVGDAQSAHAERAEKTKEIANIEKSGEIELARLATQDKVDTVASAIAVAKSARLMYVTDRFVDEGNCLARGVPIKQFINGRIAVNLAQIEMDRIRNHYT